MYFVDYSNVLSWKQIFQEDTQGLTDNMEENEKGANEKEKVDLGSLQYSIEFDFQKNEVSLGVFLTPVVFMLHLLCVMLSYS